MALGFYFSPNPPMSAQQYNECIKRLRKAGAGHPAGRVYHASFGSPENLSVFDVWTSQTAFERFGKTLAPILKELGIDAGQPQVMPIHGVIVPPAKKAASKKAAPKKKAATPKSKTSSARKKR